MNHKYNNTLTFKIESETDLHVKPKPVPRKSVNEDGYKPIPKPRTDRPLQIPKIKELNRALKGHAKSYGIELQDNLNPLNHFTKTKELVE